MYNTSNPAELYAGTTWELLPDNKFLKTGSSPLVQSGSNSIKIAKANLPTDKLQVESHSMTRGSMEISGSINTWTWRETETSGAFYTTGTGYKDYDAQGRYMGCLANFKASRSWSGSTSSASPYTKAMGSGTPITVNPEHITVKAWKRLS